jgi:hypothetical protein
MIGHRVSAMVVALLVAGAWAGASTPASAAGGPLLSGYGAPGEGEQAILGSALLGAPSGGGSGGGGASGAGQPDGSTGVADTGAATAAGGGAAGSRRGSRVAGNGARGAPAATSAPRSKRNSGSRSGLEMASRTSAHSSQTLGLSGEDLAYILAALGALAVTGALTTQLARRSR